MGTRILDLATLDVVNPICPGLVSGSRIAEGCGPYRTFLDLVG